MPRFPALRLAFLASALFVATTHAAPARPPNILVILADGLGFSDLGCYGGEAATPCLNWLSEHGLRFSQAYNAAASFESQESLLSGYYSRHLHSDSLEKRHVTSGDPLKRPGWARLLPELLKPAGYRSFQSGKWDLGGQAKDVGFDRSYMLSSEGGHFPTGGELLDGHTVPGSKQGSYASTLIADHAIQFLKEHSEQPAKAPFFAYIAFSAPQFPLQAPLDDIARYRARFHAGTDELRKARLQRLWDSGICSNAELSVPTLPAREWGQLSKLEQEAFESRMEIYAAMVERMDTEIGRVLDQVQAMKAWDNTLIIFVSTHGASAEHVTRGGMDARIPAGSAQSFLSLEAQGASLANTPFRYSDKFAHEGGISTPLIMHWPNGLKAKGEIREQVVHLIDLAPTVLKISGVSWPKSTANEGVPPSDGLDLTAVLKENRVLSSRGVWFGVEGNRGFRLGDWKWVALRDKPAELYYLKADRAEVLDLAVANHERIMEMELQWKRMQERFEKDLSGEASMSPLSVSR